MLNATLSSRAQNKSRNADVVLIVSVLFLFGMLLRQQGLHFRYETENCTASTTGTTPDTQFGAPLLVRANVKISFT